MAYSRCLLGAAAGWSPGKMNPILLASIFQSLVWSSYGAMETCEALRADVQRRMRDEKNEATTDAYDADVKGETKHKPFLRIEGSQGLVVVGKGAVTGNTSDLIHPMTPSSDPSVLHFIDLIWVEDQTGKIIAMRKVSASEPKPASMAFPIPAGTTSMTAYEHCNSHGLWKGETVTIESKQTVTGFTFTCDIDFGTCTKNGGLSASMDCLGAVSEYKRWFGAEFASANGVAVDGNTNKKHKPSLTINAGGTATVDGNTNKKHKPSLTI